MALTWLVEVDWDNDNALDADEAARCVGMQITRGRENLLDADRAFAGMNVGTATCILDNYDRRFDPFYASSPLYPNVAPGRRARIRVNDGSTTYVLFHGTIDDIVPLGGQRARLIIKDAVQRLKESKVSHAVVAGGTTGDAITDVLVALTYPFSYDINDGADTIRYWWAEDEIALDAINDLMRSELGMFFVAADGTATYRGRQDLTLQATDFTLSDAETLKDIAMPQPWVNLRNDIILQIHPPVVQNTAVIWELVGTLELSADESTNIIANFTYNSRRVAGGTVIAPVAGTDYHFNELEDGSGADLTGDLTVTTTDHGESFIISMTNDAGRPGFVTDFQIRGAAVDTPNTKVIETDDSGSSPYGNRPLTLDLRWQQNSNTAKDLSVWLAEYLGSPRMHPRFQVEARSTIQFAHDLGEVLEYTSTYLGLSSERFRIVGLTHEWQNSNGQSVVTKYICESLGAVSDAWELGVAGRSELGSTTILGF